MNASSLDFDRDVLAASEQTPVLVDFWAPWCGPCKMLGPVLEKLAASAAGRWSLVKVNTDEQPDLAAQFQIRGIPNLKLFHRRRVLAELAGALPEPQLRQWLDEHLPTPQRASLGRARELLLAGDAAAAARLLQPLLADASAPTELPALAARAFVFVDLDAARALLRDLVPAAGASDDAAIARAFADAFDSAAQPDTRSLPPPHRAPYLAAVRHLQAQRFRDAAEGLVAVLQERPNYDEGRARAACLALFKHLGLRHPLTEEFFRAYTMAVNA